VCWWTSSCGGIDLEPPPRFEVPEGFTLERRGSTDSFDYELYTAPREIQIERPHEFFTVRVFVQSP
jgi:hypothetical protein